MIGYTMPFLAAMAVTAVLQLSLLLTVVVDGGGVVAGMNTIVPGASRHPRNSGYPVGRFRAATTMKPAQYLVPPPLLLREPRPRVDCSLDHRQRDVRARLSSLCQIPYFSPDDSDDEAGAWWSSSSTTTAPPMIAAHLRDDLDGMFFSYWTENLLRLHGSGYTDRRGLADVVRLLTRNAVLTQAHPSLDWLLTELHGSLNMTVVDAFARGLLLIDDDDGNDDGSGPMTRTRSASSSSRHLSLQRDYWRKLLGWVATREDLLLQAVEQVRYVRDPEERRLFLEDVRVFRKTEPILQLTDAIAQEGKRARGPRKREREGGGRRIRSPHLTSPHPPTLLLTHSKLPWFGRWRRRMSSGTSCT